MSAVNAVLLASAVVPPVIAIALAYFFLRAGKRHDERERRAEQAMSADHVPTWSRDTSR